MPATEARAPEQIAAALDAADADDWAEVVVLIRGGGSLEDLWAFNTEPVADAIYRARLPVVTGVGHEPDVTIADFVADRRTATPSHAAQELWPRRETLAQKVDALDMGLGRAYANWLLTKGASFEHLRKALIWLSPEQRLERMEDRFTTLMARLQGAGLDNYFGCVDQIDRASGRLDRAFGPNRLDAVSGELAGLGHRLSQAAQRQDDSRAREFELLRTALHGLDPEGPLERGYALVRVDKSGGFLRDPKEVTKGDTLDIRVKRGRIAATVHETKNDA